MASQQSVIKNTLQLSLKTNSTQGIPKCLLMLLSTYKVWCTVIISLSFQASRNRARIKWCPFFPLLLHLSRVTHPSCFLALVSYLIPRSLSNGRSSLPPLVWKMKTTPVKQSHVNTLSFVLLHFHRRTITSVYTTACWNQRLPLTAEWFWITVTYMKLVSKSRRLEKLYHLGTCYHWLPH